MQLKTLNEHPLVICFRLLQALGLSGEYVWRCHKETERLKRAKAEREGRLTDDVAAQYRQERLDALRDSIAFMRAKAKDKSRWLNVPVDFRTFVESDELLKKRGVLWPGVISEGCEINSGKYNEIVLTGGIGVAKTTLAVYTQAYQLYVLSCMREPHQVFDLDPASEILIIFQSIAKHLAQDLDYGRFRRMVEESPYFNTVFPFDKSKLSQMKFPRNFIVKPVSGADTAAIGQNVIGGIIDEVNFMAVVENSKQSKDGATYDQAVANYNSIARRRESRFMQLGELPGLLCLVSSRNYPGQFTDKKEAEARTNPRIYVYDRRIWELRPERFCGKKFDVFVGDDTRKPRILEPGEIVEAEDRRLVMAIPVEYRTRFESDLLNMLRDVAGVATQALHPFMLNTDAVAACFGRVESIASREDCDFKATKLQIFPKRIVNPLEPRFAHIDLAVTGDSAGVAIGHVPGFKEMERGDITEVLPLIQFDLILEVRPPRGGEIEFENIRRLLYTLRDKLNFPLKWVSFDQFQSKDSMQILHQHGFKVGYQSMDVDTHAYDLTKAAFYDGRILAPAHTKAQKEMITLEIDRKKQKIDHPPNSSKDVSDAMAGVVIGLTLRREIWLRHGVPTHRIPTFLANRAGKNSLTEKEKREAREPDTKVVDMVEQRMIERRRSM